MIESTVKKHLVPKEDYIYGYADLTDDIKSEFQAFNFAISIGKKLDNAVIDQIENGPTLEYYNYYNLINTELTKLTMKITKDFEKYNIKSQAIAPTIALGEKGNEKYLHSLTAKFSHKSAATRAGLGWIGKTALFISNKFGPRLRLVTILLKDKPDSLGKPVIKSKCGTCNICVEKCPANAATGDHWEINKYRNDFFDAFKCREKCAELALQILKVDKRICGICVSVCPIGKKK